MTMNSKKFLFFSVLFVFVIQAFSVYDDNPKQIDEIHFPYRTQGLTERQVAAHLLSRFTFGDTPGQIDDVVKMGLENWFAKQLEGSFTEDDFNKDYLNLFF